MAGWHPRLNGHEFEQTPGDGEGQGNLVCCNPWGHKEWDINEQLNNDSMLPFPFSPLPSFLLTALLRLLGVPGCKRNFSYPQATCLSIRSPQMFHLGRNCHGLQQGRWQEQG